MGQKPEKARWMVELVGDQNQGFEAPPRREGRKGDVRRRATAKGAIMEKYRSGSLRGRR